MNRLCFAAVLTALSAAALPAWAAAVPQTAVIGGRIESVAPEGAAVSQGDVLAAVESLTGVMPAVRASSDGVVAETCVAPGETVERGDILVVIEEKETQEETP